jgi:hypothetical protein
MLICIYANAHPVEAVRKNRYVILPVDFEEAWKVCHSFLAISVSLLNALFESKLSRDLTRPMNSVRYPFLHCAAVSLSATLHADR